MVINVFSFMWMRTTMNYQYKNGGTLLITFKKLYAEGGIYRFYRGISIILVSYINIKIVSFLFIGL